MWNAFQTARRQVVQRLTRPWRPGPAAWTALYLLGFLATAATGIFAGGSPGCPVIDIRPEIAWIVRS